jgi:quinol---cytochrome c reductase cytochrome b subunit, bacillus type
MNTAAAPRDALTRARIVLVAVLTVELVLLAATGLWLVFYYRPTANAAWPTIGSFHTTPNGVGGVRGVHRVLSTLAFPTAIAAAVLVVLDARRKRLGWRQGRAALVTAPGLVVLVLAASFTGYLLPWDQLALWSVTVGTNMQGYTPVFGSSVKYVLLGSHQTDPSTMWRWFVVHTMVVSALFLAALFFAWRPRRRVEADGTEDGEDDGEAVELTRT